ncbi:MAG: hypothetical protein PSN37_01525 [Alphaproteobacteria bacterium]|nr:hypothetical protein [Alphaproteobacteria bacterium]
MEKNLSSYEKEDKNERIRACLIMAKKQLEAVNTINEESANVIIESSEAIRAALEKKDKIDPSIINDNMNRILTACSFHDLTGQHLDQMNSIFEKIRQYINCCPETDLSTPMTPENKMKLREENALSSKKLPLSGPQSKGKALTQETIDRLLSDK